MKPLRALGLFFALLLASNGLVRALLHALLVTGDKGLALEAVADLAVDIMAATSVRKEPPFDMTAGEWPGFRQDFADAMQGFFGAMSVQGLRDCQDARTCSTRVIKPAMRHAGSSELELVVITPKSAKPAGPLVVYLHYGGGVMGEARDPMAFALAAQLGAVVVSVKYALAPEHVFPAGVDDCIAGFTWAAEHASELGCDANKLVLMGASAGGSLAAAVAHGVRDARARHAPALLVAVVPMMTPLATPGWWSSARFANFARTTAFIWDRYTGGDVVACSKNAKCSPLADTAFTGLPPAVVMYGSGDMLRGDALAYVGLLRKAGATPRVVELRGGHFVYITRFEQIAREVRDAARDVGVVF